MLERVFLSHPRALGQSYLQHQRTAFTFSGSLLATGLAAAVHGVFPCLFETTTSRAVARLHARMSSRSGMPRHAEAGLEAQSNRV